MRLANAIQRAEQKTAAMKNLADRIILDSENPLFRKVHPVLLDIFCRGTQAAESKWLMLGALVSIASTPLGWLIILFRKSIHIVIILISWWNLREFISEYGSLDYLFLIIAIIAIFYKDIHDETLNTLLNLLVFVTGGGFLRWVCSGYLSGTGIRQKLLTTKPMEFLMATFVPAIPVSYRDRYDKLMNLYLNSNQANSDDLIDEILNEYYKDY